MKISFISTTLLVPILASLLPTSAQARVLVVNNQNPLASDTTGNPFITINAAAQKAEPGDEIVVHPGIYRETIVPARGGEAGHPIIYRASQPGKVVVKASETWRPQWKQVNGQNSVFRATVPMERLKNFNPFALKATTFEGNISRGQLFYQGQILTEITDKQSFTPGKIAWRALENGSLIELHSPAPAPDEIEFSARVALFRPEKRGLGYITVRGFVFEGSANPVTEKFWRPEYEPQAGAVSTRSGHHWVIEDNEIRYAKTVGLDCGSEGLGRALDGQPAPPIVGFHQIRRNFIHHNGQAGILGSRQISSQIVNNTISYNNTLHFGFNEEAGIKCHFFINCLIEGNLIHDNEAEGLWLDNVWQGTQVLRNAFISNRTSGIFMEMGRGPCLIEGNIIGWTRPGFRQTNPHGDGIYAHDAGDFTIKHNIIVNNAYFGVFVRNVTDRQTGHYPLDFSSFAQKPLGRIELPASDVSIENNLIASNRGGTFNLRLDNKAKSNTAHDNLLGAPRKFQINTYKKTPSPVPDNKIGVALSLAEWRNLTGQDRNSTTLEANATLTTGTKPQIQVALSQPLNPDFLAALPQGNSLFQLLIEQRGKPR